MRFFLKIFCFGGEVLTHPFSYFNISEQIIICGDLMWRSLCKIIIYPVAIAGSGEE